jgi:hypothetical protein
MNYKAALGTALALLALPLVISPEGTVGVDRVRLDWTWGVELPNPYVECVIYASNNMLDWREIAVVDAPPVFVNPTNGAEFYRLLIRLKQ